MFRAVSELELEDIEKIRGFRPGPGGMEVKLFAASSDDAAYYGRDVLYKLDRQPFTLVRATIPQSLRRQLDEVELDRRTAVVVYPDQLADFNQRAEITALPDIPIPDVPSSISSERRED